jgi:hypothetical protein
MTKRNKARAAQPAAVENTDTVQEEPVKQTPASRLAARIKGAAFRGGQWYAADGSLLNDVEAQAAHRAMDRKAAEDRAKALGGG